ncbi:hypothetical protein AX17_003002 [Amanita inopinata Kibby_2008]|nr:hypothetical protein AX17_003002 [Amanita inopinata Kibby_2008]
MATTTEVLSSANELLAAHSAVIGRVRVEQQHYRRRLQSLYTPPQELLKLPLIRTPSPSPPPIDSAPSSPVLKSHQQLNRPDLTPAKRTRLARYHNYVPEEETIRNDYSQRHVDGGEWPQNWVLGAEPEHRFEEYPKQQRLLQLKKASVNNHALPPTFLPFSELTSLHSCKFDVILVDPPFSSSFTWDHLQELPVPSLAADPSFVFLWVGSGAGEGLERGREVLAKWGYRRCEDVVWVKTNNTTNKGPGADPPTTSLFTRTKQHCLIGIRGTVRRSTDSWFVHCNVDTDVIIWEGDPADPTCKPPEMYTLIENFCLGLRRLEIFGRTSSIRRGWVTVMGQGRENNNLASSEGVRATPWVREIWEEGIKDLSNGGKAVVPMTTEIDALRPKSPFRPGQTTATTAGTTVAPAVGVGAVGTGPVRLVQNNRVGFVGGTTTNQPSTQNQMMVPPMMAMGMPQLPMGMGVEDMMNGWNPIMGGMGSMGGLQASGIPGMNVGVGGLGLPMMGQMGMANGFQAQGNGFGAGMFNGNMPGVGLGWGDQSQFGMEGAWENDAGMMGLGVNPMAGAMNMHGMGLGTGGMGMGQWGPNGTFDGFQ